MRLESIKNVDRILGNLDEQYAEDPPTISVQGLGAYMGEGIRSEPGSHKFNRRGYTPSCSESARIESVG